MPAIKNVGAVFATGKEFLSYLEEIKFGAWRPRFVTMHHTGAPDLKTWQGWQTRPRPVTDEQWLKNLAEYYGNTMRWSSGPHFFFTPDHFCVLSPPTARGVHAVSFNATSWGVECVGDFDREQFSGLVRGKYIEGLACLHIATGLQLDPFQKGVRGLHFHRDDPRTSKTCPGKNIDKSMLIAATEAKMDEMTDGDHPEEHVVPEPESKARVGRVNENGLNVRAAASARAPVLRTLAKDSVVNILREAMNGETKWLSIADGEWVSAKYVTI
jgi:hypothetical protein